MTKFGYALSSEEHGPADLVLYAQRAEEIGFDFAMISDHYHPWISEQGHSPFVWSVIGGIAQATETIKLGTGVTCPILRIHPAIIAQAAATAAAMMPGRFFLGAGTGENLNEHVLGDRWPPYDIRLEMLAEAVRWSICEGELIQAMGRGRGVNRTAVTPLEIDLLTDVVLPVTVDTHARAVSYAERYTLQYFDALHVASAAMANCHTLFSEDMHHGLAIDGVTVRNPFQA